MTQKIKAADMVEYIRTDEDMANYLTVVLAENDPAELTRARGTIARARGAIEVVQPLKA
jgi:probable addiction module antidote protein